MRQLAQKYVDLIHPDQINSPRFLELLDLASQGADRPYYEKAAIEKSRRDGLSTTQEKRQAYSESSNSEGDQRVKFTELSLDEMENMLGEADKD
jgi:hypothetical protein